MAGRDLNGPVTVVNRFTVKGEVGRFEREFREHSHYLRSQEGFDFLVTVQLVDQPNVFVHLSHWRNLAGFQRVVREDAFLRQVRQLGSLVVTHADQAVSVGRVLHRDALVGADNVMLTHAEVVGDQQEFEREFAELTDHFAEADGFGGSDLLRSTIRPLNYLGVSWWRDTDSCEQALGTERYREHRVRLSGLADIATERTRHVAYGRVIAD